MHITVGITHRLTNKMWVKGAFCFCIVLFSCACSASGFQVEQASPQVLSFRTTVVYFIGSGFSPFTSTTVGFSGLSTSKKYKCVSVSSRILRCNLSGGSGPFTAAQKGYYRIVFNGVYTVPFYQYVHDETLEISNFRSADGALTSKSTYNVAGGRLIELVLSGDAYLNVPAFVWFTSVGLIDGEVFVTASANTTSRSANGETILVVKTPTWKTPNDWLTSCGEPVIPGDACAPSLHATLQVSFESSNYRSPPVNITFGYVKTKLIGFIYPGTTGKFGVTYEFNKGRAKVESQFENLVDASNYTGSVVEGEFAVILRNFANASLPSLGPFLKDGRKNPFDRAFGLMKELCTRNFSLVFTCSRGYQTQTLAASASPECLSSGTKFVNIGGLISAPNSYVGFAKIYQMRYLAGIVAGGDLKKRRTAHERIHGAGSYKRACVGYIAPFPIPQVQRGINAFVLGCKRISADCVVKVLWTGAFTDELLDLDAAAFLYNIGECDILAQHSSSIESLRYFTERGGSGLGHNINARSVLGDNVLTSTLVSWEVIFEHFIRMSIAETWEPQEDYFPGFLEGAVDLAILSPKVEAVARELVRSQSKSWSRELLIPLEYRDVFCGPLKAKFVYKQRNGNGSVINTLGRPEWEELEVPKQINPRHYITWTKSLLSASDTPKSTDCLWGASVTKPGEALKGDAYPDPFDSERVFNNYLLDGVELFEPGETAFGTILGAQAVVSREGYPSGDRFFQRPLEFPLCDGSQWKRVRAPCDPATLTTPIEYTFIMDAQNKGILCGTEVNNSTGKVSTVAVLPYVAATDKLAPPCDYIPAYSLLGALSLVLTGVGISLMIGLYVMYCKYSKERTIANTQPELVRLMILSGMFLCASFALFIGEPSDEICLAQVWSINITFDFMFSMLWAKVYRLYTVYRYTRKFKRVHVRTNEIILMAMNLTLLDACILAAWTFSDPPKLRATELNLDIVDGLQSIVTVQCHSESPAFTYVMLFYKFLLIASNCLLIYLLRKAPKQLEELVPYRFILISAYNTALFGGIMVFLSIVVKEVVTRHIIYTVGGITGTMIFIGAMAGPPLATSMRKQEFLSISRINRQKRPQPTAWMDASFSDETFHKDSFSRANGSFSNSNVEADHVTTML